MTKRDAVRQAHRWAALYLREAVVAGTELVTVDDDGAPRSEADKERVLWAIEEVAQRNERAARRGGR